MVGVRVITVNALQPQNQRVITAWSLRDDVLVTDLGDNLVIEHRWGSHVLKADDPVRSLVLRLTCGPARFDDLAADPDIAAGTVAAALHRFVERFPCLVQRTLLDDQTTPLVTLTPISADATFRAVSVEPDSTWHLSRFTVVRAEAGRLLAESPLSEYRVEIHDTRVAGLLANLAHGTTVRADGALEYAWPMLVSSLAAIGMVEPSGAVEPIALQAWEPHDLLMHSRSRQGRHDLPFGATFRFLGDSAPEPAVKPRPRGEVIELARPDWNNITTRDPCFSDVLERRASLRRATRTVRRDELAELLYRAARVRCVVPPAPDRGQPYEASSRPYPSGGAGYELELYLAVNRCDGLAPGLYYYAPLEHQLILVNTDRWARAQVTKVAWVSAGGLADPDVVVTITARFRRLTWKYSAMAYATILRNTGVLYQTLYLVATAIGLSPCGLGAGDARLAASAYGLDWAAESSVGDFLVSGPPAEPGGANAFITASDSPHASS